MHWAPDASKLVIEVCPRRSRLRDHLTRRLQTDKSHLLLVNVSYSKDAADAPYDASRIPRAPKLFLPGPGEGIPLQRIVLELEGVVAIDGGILRCALSICTRSCLPLTDRQRVAAPNAYSVLHRGPCGGTAHTMAIERSGRRAPVTAEPRTTTRRRWMGHASGQHGLARQPWFAQLHIAVHISLTECNCRYADRDHRTFTSAGRRCMDYERRLRVFRPFARAPTSRTFVDHPLFAFGAPSDD